MNGELVPAVVAAGGGSVMVAGIWLHERRLDEAMRSSRGRLLLRFPAGLDPVAAKAALSVISGLAQRVELVLEVSHTAEGVSHVMLVPQAVRSSVISALCGPIPALRVSEAPEPTGGMSRIALRVFLPTPAVLSSEHPEGPLRTLAGLALRTGESVAVRWAIRPDRPRRLRAPEPMDRAFKETERAWRRKSAMPGFQVAGLVLVGAGSSARAGELAGHLSTILRSRRGPVAGLRSTSERSGRQLDSLPRTTRTSGWVNTTELLPLLMWPLGEVVIPNVSVGAARELPVPRDVSRRGRLLLVGRDSQGARPVALSTEAAKHHTGIIGPSGSGKSALIARAVLSDIERGFGGAVIDPKGPDLIDSILERVPARHADRVVVFDPADFRPVPGVAVLSGGDVDLRADVLTGVLKANFAEVWGVRSDYYGRLAIRTLGEVPGATLADIGRLFSSEPYRRAAIARLGDPFLISSWQSYEALSEAAKAEHVQAPMARVMALLSRPRVRAVLASPEPKLDIGRLFAERKWVLVSLSPGALGETAANLIGAALMHVIWAAIEARVALPPVKRHPIFLYLDELATLTGGVPYSFELLAERARGLGAGLTVAVQTLGRVPEPTRSSLLGNVATLITFRAGAEEAPKIARQLPGLSEADVMALGRFEVAARIGTGAGSAVSVVTGRTLPLPPVTGQAETIRQRSAEVYGTPPENLSPQAAKVVSGGEDVRPPGRTGRAS